MSEPAAELAALREKLAQFAKGAISHADFVAAWRNQASCLSALPPRFGEVLETMLMQVESSALTSTESCSFSADDFVTAFSQWLERAEVRLDRVSTD